MKQNQNNHLHGHRGQAFADKIRGIDPEQILCVSIDISKDFQLILIGMEPTGHYYQNLARHFHTDGYCVTIINSLAVKQNRDQQMMSREKSDEIDAASIGDLLQRGHGSLYHPPTDVYLQLQELDRERIAELKVQDHVQKPHHRPP